MTPVQTSIGRWTHETRWFTEVWACAVVLQSHSMPLEHHHGVRHPPASCASPPESITAQPTFGSIAPSRCCTKHVMPPKKAIWCCLPVCASLYKKGALDVPGGK